MSWLGTCWSVPKHVECWHKMILKPWLKFCSVPLNMAKIFHFAYWLEHKTPRHIPHMSTETTSPQHIFVTRAPLHKTKWAHTIYFCLTSSIARRNKTNSWNLPHHDLFQRCFFLYRSSTTLHASLHGTKRAHAGQVSILSLNFLLPILSTLTFSLLSFPFLFLQHNLQH